MESTHPLLVNGCLGASLVCYVVLHESPTRTTQDKLSAEQLLPSIRAAPQHDADFLISTPPGSSGVGWCIGTVSKHAQRDPAQSPAVLRLPSSANNSPLVGDPGLVCSWTPGHRFARPSTRMLTRDGGCLRAVWWAVGGERWVSPCFPGPARLRTEHVPGPLDPLPPPLPKGYIVPSPPSPLPLSSASKAWGR